MSLEGSFMAIENNINFPRVREATGHIDSGKRIGNPSDRCSNCGSSEYYQTASIEHCPECGLLCDYWGEGANDVYRAMMDRKRVVEEEERLLSQFHE